MRIILYTGKGGVGKTSIAASTALQLADQGKKVIVMSTDQAHSLSDSLDKELSFEPTFVCEGLDAMEIDVVSESEKAWGEMRGYMKELITSRAEGGIEVEELLVFPGLEELFALLKILDIYESGIYDTIIVDCAPTGETLSLLKFPEMFGMMIEKMLPMKRKMIKVAGPAVEKVTKVPMPKDSLFDEFEKLFQKLGDLQELMLNKAIVSLRIVTTPEKIVIKETKRNFACLHMYDYNVDGIVVNKVYPEEALKGYFNAWVTLQEEGLREIKESFHDVPVFYLNLQQEELKTLSVLRDIQGFYEDKNPHDVLYEGKIFSVHQGDDGVYMEVNLPFVEKSELNLAQVQEEIHISIRNEKRCLYLPDGLVGKEITSAKLEEGILRICF